MESNWVSPTKNPTPLKTPKSPNSNPNTMIHTPYHRKFNEEEACYNCKTLGHLTHNCPKTNPSPLKNQASKNQASSSKPQILLESNGETEPRILCKCGETAKPEIAKSEKNCGKWYFKCMGNCRFVEWVEMVKPEKIIWVPKCKCMAGFCRVSVENSGPNAGRASFICTIKKGQGQCPFQQWADEAEVTRPINAVAADDNISPVSNNVLLHQDLFTPPHGPQDQRSVSGLSKSTKMTTTMIVDEFKGEANPSTGEESLKLRKRLDPKFLNFDNIDGIEDTSEVKDNQLDHTGSLLSNGTCSSSSPINSVLSSEDHLLTDSMLNDHSSKELVDRYNREKKCLDDVSRDQAKAIADLEACKGSIEALDQRAANLREMLFQIETELLCRRAENQVLESEYAKVSTDEGKSVVGFETALEAVGGG